MTDTIIGASPIQQKLYDHLSRHVEDEREVLLAYEALAGSTESEAFKYMASLILEDERRHHQVLADLAKAVRSSAELSRDPSPIPYLDIYKDRESIIAATDRLLKVEDEDRRQLKALAKELEGFEDTTLWSLMVKLMQADNDKHRMILRLVRKNARKA